MLIKIEHFGGDRPQFNVALHSAEGKEAFLVIKGCRIVNGSNGEFVSWPATKNESTGKWWQHAWASEGFNAAVLAEAKKAKPRQAPRRESADIRDMDSDIPF